MVDGTVREGTLFLEPSYVIHELLPGNILREFTEDVGKVNQVSADVSGIRLDCMAGKATEGDHLPKLF